MKWVLGIDPPNGAAAWTAEGPAAVLVCAKRHSLESADALGESIDALVAELGPPAIAALERPYGVRTGSHLQAILVNAHSAGYLHRHVREFCSSFWRPTAPMWRGPLGLPHAPRERAKAMAKGLAEKAWAETRGGPLVLAADHGHEAMCLAAACWLRHFGDGVIRTWQETGRFA